MRLRDVLTRVRRLSPNGVFLTAIAVGLTLLADGLRNFQTYVLKRETAESDSPIPYGGRFGGWQPVVQREGVAGPWYLVFGASPSQGRRPLCLDLPPDLPREVAVLEVAKTGPFGRVACDVTNHAAREVWLRQPVDSLGSGARSLLTQGFVVLDSTFRVVYGSKRFADLARIPDSLALFEHRTSGARATQAYAGRP